MAQLLFIDFSVRVHYRTTKSRIFLRGRNWYINEHTFNETGVEVIESSTNFPIAANTEHNNPGYPTISVIDGITVKDIVFDGSDI